ncbi:hypothetical protein Bca4012_020804 [Brassica carinata]
MNKCSVLIMAMMVVMTVMGEVQGLSCENKCKLKCTIHFHREKCIEQCILEKCQYPPGDQPGGPGDPPFVPPQTLQEEAIMRNIRG